MSEELYSRLGGCLDVLEKIGEDIRSIRDQLRGGIKGDLKPKQSYTSKQIRDRFPDPFAKLLEFKDIEDYVRVKPVKYLGSDNFAHIAEIVKELDGEYVSAGRDSHFRVPKK